MRARVFARDETGTSMAEYAIIAGLFFMMIFGIIEFGRLLYTHNALTDAARRGARYAVLHNQSTTCVRNVVVYGETHINPANCSPTGPPLINDLTTANVFVVYDGADIDNDPATPNPWGANLGTASVTIRNYTFRLLIPLAALTLNMPAYTTTLTTESAGWVPANK